MAEAVHEQSRSGARPSAEMLSETSVHKTACLKKENAWFRERRARLVARIGAVARLLGQGCRNGSKAPPSDGPRRCSRAKVAVNELEIRQDLA